MLCIEVHLGLCAVSICSVAVGWIDTACLRRRFDGAQGIICREIQGGIIMKMLAINGSPRKNGNTAILLQRALDGAAAAGAETEMIHLYDLNFKGCTSCFACKHISGTHFGRCAMQDDLSPVLLEAMSSQAILFGSPIYFGDVTGEMRSFLERLFFMNLTYNNPPSYFEGSIHCAGIFTMNAPEEAMVRSGYEAIFSRFETTKRLLHGTWEYLAVTDTYQFDNYADYRVSIDEARKAEVRATDFPIACQNAFDLGHRLAHRV